tara:strand:- start:305 stop:1021 length:717 start_codon:yes stop_codon:yes gene_type:complete
MRNTGTSATFVVNLYDDFGHIATDVLRICTKCEKAKDLSNFGVHSTRASGVQEVCRACKSMVDKLLRARTLDKCSENHKKYYLLHRDSIMERVKQYSIDNSESIKQKNKERFQLNKEKWNQYGKDRAKVDPVYRMKVQMRKLLIKALNGQSKSKTTEEIIGCTYIELKNHIESQFESWMTWSNKGLYNGDFNYGWDVDHIIPLASAKSPEEILYLNHYTNLRPLCSHVNRNIKRDKHE